jgi:hypothetical protein
MPTLEEQYAATFGEPLAWRPPGLPDARYDALMQAALARGTPVTREEVDTEWRALMGVSLPADGTPGMPPLPPEAPPETPPA